MKKLVLLSVAVLMVFAGQGMAEEKKSKEQILKEVKERLQAEAERKKKFKIQVIKDKEAQFLDDNRQVRKRISLERVWDKVKEKRTIGNTEKTYTWDREIHKDITINNNGKYALIGTYKLYRGGGDEAGVGIPVPSSAGPVKITFVDEGGNTLWQRELPEEREPKEKIFISDNGDVVAVLTKFSLDSSIEGIPNELVYVFNKKGNEILRIPSTEEFNKNMAFNVLDIEKLSPSGKYLALRVSQGSTLAYPRFTRFYNLTNKKYWDTDKDYTVYSISDVGLVRVGDYNVSGQSVDIDLKNYIGD